MIIDGTRRARHHCLNRLNRLGFPTQLMSNTYPEMHSHVKGWRIYSIHVLILEREVSETLPVP